MPRPQDWRASPATPREPRDRGVFLRHSSPPAAREGQTPAAHPRPRGPDSVWRRPGERSLEPAPRADRRDTQQGHLSRGAPLPDMDRPPPPGRSCWGEGRCCGPPLGSRHLRGGQGGAGEWRCPGGVWRFVTLAGGGSEAQAPAAPPAGPACRAAAPHALPKRRPRDSCPAGDSQPSRPPVWEEKSMQLTPPRHRRPPTPARPAHTPKGRDPHCTHCKKCTFRGRGRGSRDTQSSPSWGGARLEPPMSPWRWEVRASGLSA